MQRLSQLVMIFIGVGSFCAVHQTHTGNGKLLSNPQQP